MNSSSSSVNPTPRRIPAPDKGSGWTPRRIPAPDAGSGGGLGLRYYYYE